MTPWDEPDVNEEDMAASLGKDQSLHLEKRASGA